MLSDPPDLETYRALLDAHGLNEETLVTRGGTLFAARSGGPLPTLPRLTGDDRELELTGSLGKGGMGVIHLARQRSLDREIAVKQARYPEGGRDEATASLIAEARVTGSLEHPNIVPVHMLGQDEEGEVLLAMKRIEGTPWSRLLKDRADPAEDLERHVRILVNVCDALVFAHERGVIHRDIKPSNVMVGSFGEIYLLDWGLAVGVSESAPPGVPRSDELSDLVGTPAYMAPEMALPDGVIDERTDLYLVGAVLHKVVTGRAPHRGKDVVHTLHAAHTAPQLRLPDGVPEELAEIVQRALRRDPAERFQTARELRAALEAYLQHKAARDLTVEADERLAALNDEDPDDTLRAFTEARFGYQQALRVWPESSRAAAGLSAAIERMVELELDAGRVDAAALLLRDHPSTPPALAARVEALRSARAADHHDLEVLRASERERDTRTGARGRALLLVVLAAFWLAVELVTGALGRAGLFTPSVGEIVVAQVVVLIGVTLGAIAFRRVLLSNRVSRALMTALFVCILGCLGVELVGWLLPLSLPATLGLVHVVMWVAVAVTATHERHLWPAVILLPFGLLALVFPDVALEVNGVVLFAALTGVAWRIYAATRASAGDAA